MSDTTTSFSSWRDRLTYVVAEAQWLVAGGLVFLGILILWWRPSVPAAPPWMVHFLAAILILGPPLFMAGLKFASWLRTRHYVEVFHVNAVDDELEKYLVPPEVWAEKTVEGADPWPVKGGSAWAVREWDWLEETETLVISGVWLSEVEDTKLLTSKEHMSDIYEYLVGRHITLGVMRDSISQLGADIQEAVINSTAEAREAGKMMDKSAVSDVFEDFEDKAESVTEEDLPTLDDVDADDLELLEDPTPDVDDVQEDGAGEAVATDGGEP